ncbi:MAG: RsmB/NOP family class I SAM-dependent RNA methyltransferase [Rothia sp. (in: high G+C Gram-positive bacteria)]|uniref:RsmB/NOP family class I SAM-dependent RNA methyltransferase n=1 Tax=Rothia sp. (in: high G+C Gram-positive bacteria) TaxID=1885016 RepID=UPI0026F51D92|nr:RsmB/NOP family class I SAM-dependent RNA methyltransferase [Rothia sp. (in: high G+C Gram-positive bacteria)]
MSMNAGGRGSGGRSNSGKGRAGANRSGANRAGQGRSGARKRDDRTQQGQPGGTPNPRGSRGNRNPGGEPQTKQGGGGETRRNSKGHERNRKAVKDRAFSASAPSQRARTADRARAVAFEVLSVVALEDSYANLVLPKAIRSARLDARDAGFATELTYGTLRNQGTYDAILAHCVDRPVAKIGTKILLVLRLGVHQLLAMRVPDHAALNQTVALARAEIGTGPANFVNAVLRRVSERTPEDWYALIAEEAPDELTRLALEKSHPAWVVRSFRQALAAHGRKPDEVEALLDADNASPVVNLVALPGLGDLDEARAAGAENGPLVEGSAFYSAGDLARLESVREGVVRAQDAGSQLVARALADAPLEGSDSNWLDLCAGPGGKAALLGALGAQRGARLLANEAADHRAELVRRSLAPLPSGTYSVVAGDGRQIARTVAGGSNLPEGMPAGVRFDRVMVDVPCSGLGALRRRPEARWRKSPRDIAELLPLQLDLFKAAASVTRPCGLIAYVTCSPHTAETQSIVHDILRKVDVTLLDSGAALRAVARKDEAGASTLSGKLDPAFTPEAPKGATLAEGATTAQLWPHIHGTDAMFFALFRKN